ncbi:glycosyltransferase family 4 protein [Phyllobacterium sp. BT25]|uniref:Glycosyltransferase family 4 protein n=1 Tax=Phyllobacterium pellucidum TaxID=2740464 RepID=A0A849VPB1_9HYPH|nr:glycosyltransferase family 4 protein [Phyllobacterium sp. T1018]NTS31945.1 glycosyltransferase family 4 protein [Phyllobacterium pellucidum]UGY09384.1 glycosyltransferase family 4 protein [Phyllobacterium sp. T1018]
MSNVEVIAPNFKRTLSGVTSTIIQLIPLQRANGLKIATLGPGLPDDLSKIRWLGLPGLWLRPRTRPFRIWHARRNTEMVAGILMRSVLRMRLKLLFTSAAQRDHRSFTKWLIRQMNAVIATSGKSGSFLEVPHTVIMHGVDTERFHPPSGEEDSFAASGLPGKYLIGCSGRIRHSKGTDLFVDAMISLLPHHPEWTAIMTGRTTVENKGFEQELRQKIAAAGLEDRILFLGEVPDVRIWYRRMTLYVAPSRKEGFGLTPLEAMASQTAVVASDAGAYAEMITPEAGSVVPAGDGKALEAAIAPYLADPAQCANMGKAGLAHVRQNFPLEKEAGKILDVYEAIFAGGLR